MNTGWVCPVCNRGVAPTEKTCSHGEGAISGINPWPHYVMPCFKPDGTPNLVPSNIHGGGH